MMVFFVSKGSGFPAAMSNWSRLCAASLAVNTVPDSKIFSPAFRSFSLSVSVVVIFFLLISCSSNGQMGVYSVERIVSSPFEFISPLAWRKLWQLKVIPTGKQAICVGAETTFVSITEVENGVDLFCVFIFLVIFVIFIQNKK